MLTPAELDARLAEPESATLERKRTAGDRSAIRRAICAMANAIGGTGEIGLVVVGLEYDGTCANLAIDDDLIQLLANMRNAGSILPWPDMQVVRHDFRGCPLAVVEVRPAADPPVRYEGRVWIRVGSTTQLASPQDEQRLTECQGRTCSSSGSTARRRPTHRSGMRRSSPDRWAPSCAK